MVLPYDLKITTMQSAFVVSCLLRGRQSMKRKPDLLWVLAIVFGLGVVTTGYTQSLWDRQDAPQTVQQP